MPSALGLVIPPPPPPPLPPPPPCSSTTKIKRTRKRNRSNIGCSCAVATCAHVAMHIVRTFPFPSSSLFQHQLVFLLSLSSLVVVIHAAALFVDESDALLKFKGSLTNTTALWNWNPSTSPCSGWFGVRCLADRVWVLQLRGMSLSGNFDVEALVPLPHLRAISLINNDFQGPFPRFNTLGALKSIYLSYNQFSGEIPDDAFTGMGSLKKVYVAYNDFTGRIPSSLATLPKLLELRMEGNQFQGQIPNFRQIKGLRLVNVSHNLLEGPIPKILSKMDITSFLGNDYLCGEPLDPCGSSPAIWKVAIGVFVAGLAIGVIVVVAIIIIVHHRRRRKLSISSSSSSSRDEIDEELNSSIPHHVYNNNSKKSRQLSGGTGGAGGGGSTHRGRGGRRSEEKLQLCFVKDDGGERFDLQDLLRASAEVLGSGNFGSSYKATITSGQSLVVKRYKQMTGVGRDDFNDHMRRLGKLKHPNLLTLTAYYYRKEEKLLVFDFVPNACLATHLHGNRGEAGGLDWKTRLNIIKGVCRGLSYLYSELPNLVIPHGHLKSSNVLLDESLEPLLTDYALAPITNPEHARQLMVAYRSPECCSSSSSTTTHQRTHGVSNKSDIWSLGTLILETLTGRFPVNYISQQLADEEDVENDLASWVVATVNEGKTGEVFDKEMGGTKDSKGEMIKLLNLGLTCCEQDMEKRLSIVQVVDKVEELTERDIVDADATSNDQQSAFASCLVFNSSLRAVAEGASR